MRRVLSVLTILAGIAIFAPLVFSQATDGNIVGALVDQSGAGVPGATVDIQNVATGVRNTTKAGNSGEYRFNNVLVGTYTVSASAAGFTKASLANVKVDLNK